MLDLCCCTCFSLIRQAGATLWLWHTGSHCSDFSCCGGQALGCAGFSSCGSQALEHRLNSCDTWTQLLHGMWDLTGSGIEPTSLVLANGFFITEPPSEVKDTQSCSTLCNPMDYTVHGILQARILEWVAFPFYKGSAQPRDRTQFSRIAGRFFTSWATREASEPPRKNSNINF